MSLFTPVTDVVTSAFDTVVSKIKGIFVDDVAPAITTFLHVLETNGGSALIALAIETITAAESGTPFGVLTTNLIASGEAAGIQVAEIAAKSALQVAKTHLESLVASSTSIADTADAPTVAESTPAA